MLALFTNDSFWFSFFVHICLVYFPGKGKEFWASRPDILAGKQSSIANVQILANLRKEDPLFVIPQRWARGTNGGRRTRKVDVGLRLRQGTSALGARRGVEMRSERQRCKRILRVATSFSRPTNEWFPDGLRSHVCKLVQRTKGNRKEWQAYPRMGSTTTSLMAWYPQVMLRLWATHDQTRPIRHEAAIDVLRSHCLLPRDQDAVLLMRHQRYGQLDGFFDDLLTLHAPDEIFAGEWIRMERMDRHLKKRWLKKTDVEVPAYIGLWILQAFMRLARAAWWEWQRYSSRRATLRLPGDDELVDLWISSEFLQKEQKEDLIEHRALNFKGLLEYAVAKAGKGSVEEKGALMRALKSPRHYCLKCGRLSRDCRSVGESRKWQCKYELGAVDELMGGLCTRPSCPTAPHFPTHCGYGQTAEQKSSGPAQREKGGVEQLLGKRKPEVRANPCDKSRTVDQPMVVKLPPLVLIIGDVL